jgi:hypothetical protein
MEGSIKKTTRLDEQSAIEKLEKRRDELDKKINERRGKLEEKENKRIAAENFNLGELLREALPKKGTMRSGAAIKDYDEIEELLRMMPR